jgi:hypothetical protein
MRKRAYAVFFVLLVFHVGLIIPKTKFECTCDHRPEGMSCCCNCPYCVGKRGGFLSACSCHERTEKPLGDIPLIGRAICHCGYHSDFDLPGLKYPIFLGNNLFPPPALEIHHFFPILSTLSSQVYLTLPDHPT